MKCAVVLSGSGVFDGSEIHESVLTLLALEKVSAQITCFSVNKNQHHCVNHLTGQEDASTRHCMQESARISRGNIEDLSNFDAKSVDALIFPGGFGVAKNLCDFALSGEQMTIDSDVSRAILSMRELDKPLGFMCIAPILAAKLIPGVTVTVGEESDVSRTINAWGGIHQVCRPSELVIDAKHNVVSTPAYMCDTTLMDIENGITALVNHVATQCKVVAN